jgi:hypothetical protein
VRPPTPEEGFARLGRCLGRASVHGDARRVELQADARRAAVTSECGPDRRAHPQHNRGLRCRPQRS